MSQHRLLQFSLAVIVVGIVVYISLCVRAIQRWSDSFVGPPHVFALTEPLPTLSDDFAVAKARQALALDGFGSEPWNPVPVYMPTTGPSTEPVRYLYRNTLNPNSGFVEFCREPEGWVRDVMVELDGMEVRCQVTTLKSVRGDPRLYTENGKRGAAD